MNHSMEAAAPLAGAGVSEAPMKLVRSRVRLDSIDLVRGLALALMVLAHARDIIGAPGDLPHLMTHLGAPVFALLAGVSAFLYGSWGRTTRELSLFLLTRGVFLVLLEMASARLLPGIGVIGASLVALSALVHLPQRAIAAVGLAGVLAHPLLDGIGLYPLILSVGVMALGYALGPVMVLAPKRPARGALARVLVTIGRVPLAFYVLHLLLLHAVAVVTPRVWHADTQGLVYAVWIAALAALYPVCRAFAELKQRRADAWLSYV